MGSVIHFVDLSVTEVTEDVPTEGFVVALDGRYDVAVLPQRPEPVGAHLVSHTVQVVRRRGF